MIRYGCAGLTVLWLAGLVAAQPAAPEDRLARRLDRAEQQLRADVADWITELRRDREAIAALPGERRAAVERLLMLVMATPRAGLVHLAIDLERAEFVPLPVLGERLARIPLVCVGEQHDQAAHHQLQGLIQAMLAWHNPQVGLGLEMLPGPVQPHLDTYTQGGLDEPAMLAAVGWRDNWGFDWSLYADLLRHQRTRQAAILALNVPRELIRQVSRQGLAALDPAARAQLPTVIETADARHRQRFEAAMRGHHGAAQAPALERYYQAMCVWDEAMAERASSWLVQEKSRQMLLIAGVGHLTPEGIPARARKRGLSAVAVIVPLELDGMELAAIRSALLEPHPQRYLVFIP
jgi:uncharacterized iron-regulated protein